MYTMYMCSIDTTEWLKYQMKSGRMTLNVMNPLAAELRSPENITVLGVYAAEKEVRDKEAKMKKSQ